MACLGCESGPGECEYSGEPLSIPKVVPLCFCPKPDRARKNQDDRARKNQTGLVMEEGCCLARPHSRKNDNRKTPALFPLLAWKRCRCFLCCDIPGSLSAVRGSVRVYPLITRFNFTLSYPLRRILSGKTAFNFLRKIFVRNNPFFLAIFYDCHWKGVHIPIDFLCV